MSFKFGNKLNRSEFKFGNKVHSNPQMTFGNKVNQHGRGANGFDINSYDENSRKPKESDLEKHHDRLTATHRMHHG